MWRLGLPKRAHTFDFVGNAAPAPHCHQQAWVDSCPEHRGRTAWDLVEQWVCAEAQGEVGAGPPWAGSHPPWTRGCTPQAPGCDPHSLQGLGGPHPAQGQRRVDGYEALSPVLAGSRARGSRPTVKWDDGAPRSSVRTPSPHRAGPGQSWLSEMVPTVAQAAFLRPHTCWSRGRRPLSSDNTRECSEGSSGSARPALGTGRRAPPSAHTGGQREGGRGVLWTVGSAAGQGVEVWPSMGWLQQSGPH